MTETYVTPRERFGVDELDGQRRSAIESETLGELLEAFIEPIVVLNLSRQIVNGNHAARRFFDACSIDELVGRRPGEALGCIYAEEGPDGCGTGRHCVVCGAARALGLTETLGGIFEHDCIMLRRKGRRLESLTLAVRSAPLRLEKLQGDLFSFHDRSDLQRKRELERSFFHDVLNSAGGLVGALDLLRCVGGEDEREGLLADAIASAEKLVAEVRLQQSMTMAEAGRCIPAVEEIHLPPFVEKLAAASRRHECAREKRLLVASAPEIRFRSDPVLLGRVVGNMIVNALEGSEAGEVVRLGSEELGRDRLRIWVHNPGRMPDDVALQIFRRSFTTKKGRGRGLGTHAMKLLGEEVLGGRVQFATGASEGTTFEIVLPIEGPRPPSASGEGSAC